MDWITNWPDFKGIKTEIVLSLGFLISFFRITNWPDFKGIKTSLLNPFSIDNVNKNYKLTRF